MSSRPIIFFLSTALFALAITGCTTEPVAPGPSDHELGVKLAEPPATAKAAEATPVAPWSPRSAQSGARDPFQFEPERGPGSDPEAHASLDLSTWRLAGIVTGTALKSLVLIDPEGLAHFPREGERVRDSDVRVVDVRDGEAEFSVGIGDDAPRIVLALHDAPVVAQREAEVDPGLEAVLRR